MPRKKLYLYAGILTIFLYSLGFLSGIYISQKSSADQPVAQLRAEIQKLGVNLEALQLQQLYISASETAMGCSFLVTDINKIQEDLNAFYQKLPHRLEEFESNGQTNPQYEEIKKEYMLVSLRVWLLSTIAKDKCKKDIVPILYFYSSSCSDCIKQGSILDVVRNETPSIAVFTIDLRLDEQIVNTIKETYNITKTPALVIHNKVYETLMEPEMIRVAIGR
jgi:thiol-disulfide isomerase/thioredoxin